MDERDQLLAMPAGFRPSYADLLEAVKAYKFWDIAEHHNLGTFHDKMDLCSYAEWMGDKALGRAHKQEWAGVPRLVLTLKEG